MSIVRRKRKRKIAKINNKILFSLIACLTFVLTATIPNDKSEALAFTSVTQPINIMYSLLTKSYFNQFDEMNSSIHNKLQSINKFTHEKDIQADVVQNTKKEAEKTAAVQKKDDSQTSNLKVPASSAKDTPPAKEEKEQKIIYLTFDDGPSAYTLNILESLKAYNMKATFFMLEPNMRAYPEELHAIINHGHIPALHGVTHNVAKIYRSEKTVVNEMAVAQATLMKMTGTGTSLIRTPYGSAPYMKPSYKKAVEAAGFQLWDWTVDSEDWKYKNGEYVERVIGQIEKFQYKDRPIVILLHDRKTTAEHLPDLLTYLQTNGYKAEILNEKLSAFHF